MAPNKKPKAPRDERRVFVVEHRDVMTQEWRPTEASYVFDHDAKAHYDTWPPFARVVEYIPAPRPRTTKKGGKK